VGREGRAGRRRPALNFSASNGVARDTRRDPHFGADPQFDNPIVLIIPALVPSPRRDRPAAVGMPDGIKWDGRGMHGNAWDGMG
jgi:hypothetical protein